MNNSASPKNAEKPSIQELSEAQLDALIVRIQEAKAHSLALSAEDYDLLINAMLMLASMHERLGNNDLTIAKLKKLLGMVSSSEKLKDLRPQGGAEGDNNSAAPQGKAKKDTQRRKKRPKAPAVKPTVHHHALEGMSKGQVCPSCGVGKLYKYEPATLLRIVGHSPLSAHRHVAEQLRCSACGEIFTADLPESLKSDGRARQKYGYSARAVMAIYRYMGGSPFYRQETLQNVFGFPVSASTVFDQCAYVSEACEPVFAAFKAMAANADLFYLDDTTNRILNKKPIEKIRNGRLQWRTGVYTSAAIAEVKTTDPPPESGSTHRRIMLFQTNIGHAGEWLDELLCKRTPELEKPLLMSDALSSNHVTTIDYIKCLCNVHARRNFAELSEQQPERVLPLLEAYQQIWKNDDYCKDSQLDPQQRLAWHQEHSLPIMQSIKTQCEEAIGEPHSVEPNSNLGKAMAYFIRHYEGLTAFCRIAGAPVDNNSVEQIIKAIVLARKNSLFFKTERGAEVSDILTSILTTCSENGVNAFDYLQAIQRNQLSVRATPERWLPWNYPKDK